MFDIRKEVMIDKSNGIDYSGYSSFTKFISGCSKVFCGNEESLIYKSDYVKEKKKKEDLEQEERDLVLLKTDNGIGYADLLGNVVIKPTFRYAFPFNGNYAVVMKEKWGIIDKNGNEVVPCIYSDILDMNEDMFYIDGSVYEVENIKLKYLLHISYNKKIITKEFDSMEMLEFYKNALCDSLFNIISLTSDDIINECMIKKRRK